MGLGNLDRLIEQIDGKRIVVFGDAMLDEYLLGTTDRVSREAPVPIVIYDRSEQRLGGAANAARNVVALGGRCEIVTVVGRDRQGRALVAAIRRAGISQAGVVRVAGRPTLTKLRVLAGAPETGRQQVLRIDWQPRVDLDADARRAVDASLSQVARSSAAILVSDYGGGSVHPGALRRLVRLARRMPVIIDSRYRLHEYHGPFVLKPNAPELARATGLATDSDRGVVRAARALIEVTGARAVLATRGRAGMSLVSEDGLVRHRPIYGGEDVTDVTGAGDTVAATAALALAAGASFVDAMDLATVAAGLVVQRLGAATATAAEIRRAVRGAEVS